jgi:hypothetical protein
MQNFDSFQLNEQTVVHEEVETQWFVKNKPFILHANYFLRCNRNRTQFQLAQQTSLVNRFDQPWSLTPMDLDRCSNNLATEAVGFLTMDALQRVFTEGGGGNKDLQFLSSEDLRYLRFVLLALIEYGSL